MKIRKMACIACMLLCLLLLPGHVQAETVTGGNYEGITWSLDDSGLLTLSGNGAIADGFAPWFDYREQITALDIGDGITAIGSDAFNECTALTAVTIPNSVVAIGDYAFYYCEGLRQLHIGSAVTVIGDHAFASCTALESLVIPGNVETLGDRAFYSCDALSSLRIESGVKQLGSGVFSRCAKLKSVQLPDTVTDVGSSAFSYCGSLKSVILSKGMTGIGGSTFSCCYALENITVPEGVTQVGASAFRECVYLSEITLPASLTTVGNSAFNMCMSLKQVNFGGSQAQWDGVTIGANNTCLTAATVICTGGGHVHDFSGEPVVVAPDCVQPGSKTYTCSCGLTQVETIPAAGHTEVVVAAVEPTCTENGWSESSYCGVCGLGLKERTYINPTGHMDVTYATVEPTCTEPGLESYTACTVCGEKDAEPAQIPALGHDPVTDPAVTPGCTYPGKTEGSHCTRCYAVLVAQEEIPAVGHTEVIDPAVEPGCSYMGRTEGKHCSVCGLTLVEQEWIPASHKEQTLPAVAPTCTATGLTAGVQCSECGEILVAQETVPMASHSFANGACTVCKLSQIIASGTVGDGVTWTLDYAYTLTISGVGYMNSYEYATLVPWYNYRWSVKKIVVENGITAIGDRAFFECREVTEVTLPNSVYSIGECAFDGCAKLARVFIPANVGEIGNAAFYGCSALQSIELPQRLTSISARTFMNCTSLTSVTVPAMVTMLDVEAFKGCSALQSVLFPDGLQIIGDGSFCECRALALADIPETVTYVGREAFKYCEGISAIYIPDSVERIGEFAFCGCIGATTAVVSQNVTALDVATFLGCKALQEVTLPAKLVSVDRYAFDVTALEKVTFGGSCSDWKNVTVEAMNDPLRAACIQCSDGHVHVYVDGLCKWCDNVGVQVVEGEKVTYFETLSEALAASPNGYVRLQGDLTQDVTVTATASLDINGCALTGNITVAEGAILYLFDSATADYTAENRGRIVGTIDGEVARCFNTLESTGYNYKYLVLQEEDGSWSSHRYYLSVRAAVLVPYAEGYGTAVNYKTVFKCNAVAAQYIAQYGLKLTGDNVIYADYMARGMELLSGGENTNTATTFLQGVLRKENTAAQNAANALLAPDAQAYIVLSDGTELTSAAVKVSAKELIAAAVEAEELTAAQQRSLARMYMTFRDVLDAWEDVDLETLRSYAQQFGLMQVALLPDDKKIA